MFRCADQHLLGVKKMYICEVYVEYFLLALFSPQHFQVFTNVLQTNQKVWHPERECSALKGQEVS